MSKFVFRLQAALDLRERELACRVAELEMRRSELRANLLEQAGLQAGLDQLEREFVGLSGARQSPLEFIHYVDYRHGLELALDRLKESQVLLEENVRAAEEIVQEAARTHRRLELLKERTLEAWRSEQQHKEIQLIDEWGSMRSGRST